MTGLGLDELRQAIADVVATVRGTDPSADVRFWVDRCFALVRLTPLSESRCGSAAKVSGSAVAARS